MRKKRGKTGKKWARYGLKRVKQGANQGSTGQVLALRHEFEGSFIVSVEQWGMMRSMNVAVAAGIVMHHCASWHVQRLAT